MRIKKRVKVLAGLIALLGFAAFFFVQRNIQIQMERTAQVAWQNSRLEALVDRESGWLNLAGLFWLEEGRATMGTGAGNDFVLRESTGPARFGTFIRKGDSVTFVIPPEVPVMVDGAPATERRILLKDDDGGEGTPTVLSLDALQWWLIVRDGMLGVRVRDLQSERLQNFAGIDRFSFDAEWKINAQFLSFENPRVFEYPTILGTMREEEAPGVLVFEVEGQQFEMVPFERDGGTRLFLVFGDQTNGETTYEGGRFLYVDLPNEMGQTVIDFNRAYNPPCAFSPYSTCPQPLRQNRLALAVTAGERVYRPDPETQNL